MTEEKELKMWLAVRADIEIPAGKLAAQAGHGFCSALREAIRNDEWAIANDESSTYDPIVDRYFRMDQPKITVVAKNLAALERVYKECQDAGLPCSFIIDAGRTIFTEPTPTVVGIGPCYKDELPQFVKRLQLMKD